MTVCKQVRYTGHVQGVGFRYTVRELAQTKPISGYVRNLPDGSVELVAQGKPAEVEDLLEQIQQRMAGYIERCEVSDGIPPGSERFEIRYS